jgi:hypothetical protein
LFQNAKVEYINDIGEIVRTEPVVRHEHKVYKGQAYVRDEETREWRHSGWTRITVLRDGSSPLFEGVFVKDGDVHHVKLLSKYNLKKDSDDVHIGFEDEEETMVVHRDSDRLISQAKLLQRSADSILTSTEANISLCGHDGLSFNVQNEQRLRGVWYNSLGRLLRRQGSDISGATGGSQAQLGSTIGDTTGCTTTRQVALVAAAADCSYVTMNGNSSSTRSNIISIYNQVFPYLIRLMSGVCRLRKSIKCFSWIE